jgi:scyllo-inositol 2-dehydrogenase (NADP+)
MAKRKSNSDGPIRTAIVGLGRAGWSIHVAGLKTRTDYKIVACIDPEAERRKEAEETLGCRTYAEWKDFIKDPGDAELVIVATASAMHVPMSIDALKAGLHVLTEKPMAIDLKQARQMIAAAKKAKTLYTVHQNYRCNPELHQALAIMNSGILGKVYYIKMNWSNFARRNDWQTLRKFGGGTLNNTGPHSLDYALQMLQSPVVDVWGDLQAVVTAGDADDHVKILMRAKNGRVLDHELSNACAIAQPKLMIMGSLGTLTREGDDYLIKYLDPKTLPKLKVDARLAVPGRKYGVQGDTLQWLEKRLPANPPEMKVDFYAELYKSISEGKPLFIKPEEVYEQMRVNALARKGTKFAFAN